LLKAALHSTDMMVPIMLWTVPIVVVDKSHSSAIFHSKDVLL
jgi:hypothetical protein